MSLVVGLVAARTEGRHSPTSWQGHCRLRRVARMHFTGTTVLRLEDGKIVEEIGLDDGVTALTQLGLIRAV